MNKRSKIFFLTTTIISLIFMLIGTTLSYFTVKARSNLDAVAADAGKIRLGLSISPLYSRERIIPLKDTDIERAYNQNCLDDANSAVCLAYNIEISNFNLETEIEGIIDYNITGIKNLSYLVLDEAGNRYTNINHIAFDNSTNLTLGPAFQLPAANGDIPTKKRFTLIIWLTETGAPQEDDDSDGSFSATVTYSTDSSSRLTGTISGIQNSG